MKTYKKIITSLLVAMSLMGAIATQAYAADSSTGSTSSGPAKSIGRTHL